MSIVINTIVDSETDIFFSYEDMCKEHENGLLKSLKTLSLDPESDLCDKFNSNMNIKPRFKKVNSDNIYIRYVPADKYLVLINNRNSYIRCHLTDNFFILNSYNFIFRKVKSMARFPNGKIILKLVFSIKNLNEFYEEKDSEESSDVDGSDYNDY